MQRNKTPSYSWTTSRIATLFVATFLLSMASTVRAGDVARMASTVTAGNLVHPSENWTFPVGRWEWRARDGRQLLAQTGAVPKFAVALLRKQRWQDADVTVRFRPLSGDIDASGGIVFRAIDENNYYIVRANSLEDNFRLYTVVGGNRRQIAGVTIPKPALGQWHSIRVAVAGDGIKAYLNGKLLIEHRDGTFADGYVGLWTKADAVTEFTDMRVTQGSAGRNAKGLAYSNLED